VVFGGVKVVIQALVVETSIFQLLIGSDFLQILGARWKLASKPICLPAAQVILVDGIAVLVRVYCSSEQTSPYTRV